MLQLFRIKGFLAFTVMVFLNAFVDLGHKIIVQNTVFMAYDGPEQVVLTAIVNALDSPSVHHAVHAGRIHF